MKKISTITRTKNRPALLRRVAESLQSQTYEDFEWVVVNDGGDADPVRQIILDYKKSGRPAKLILNKQSIGMEAAANLGIEKSKSKYIHILDDDDTIDPKFYKSAIEWLEVHRKKAVTFNINKVFEYYSNEKIEQIRIEKWYTGMPSIARMVCINRFVPVSFLYERAVHSEIGLYNPSLHACGDWEFYLRFLRKYDIGKVEDFLANYHVREQTDNPDLDNSVNKRYVHEMADMEIRNSLLRSELDNNNLGYAGLIVVGAQLWDIEFKVYTIFRSLEGIKKFFRPIANVASGARRFWRT